jgi:methionine-rich copper-binding protein CopC
LELRLLSDPAFGEELDTIVDEITDDYLQRELRDDERERVEKYFLSSTERQNKLEFATELLRRAESERGRQVKEVLPGPFDRIVAFLRQPVVARAVMTAASIIVVVGIFYTLFKPDNTKYIPLALTINTAERNEGAAATPVKLPPHTGLKITLTIPEDARGAKSYVARLSSGTDLKIEQATAATVTVIIPPGSLPPDTYAIQLSKVSPDGRIPGSYYFAIE